METTMEAARETAKGTGSVTMDRQQRYWQKIVEKRQSAVLSLNRARLVTDAYRETEGLSWVIRKAKAFEKIMAEIPIFIEEDDLLLGNYGSEPLCLEWNAENDCTWVLKEAESGELWEHYPVRREDIPEIKEICKYWQNKSRHESYYSWLELIGLGDESRDIAETEKGAWAIYLFNVTGLTSGHQVPGYEEYLKKGLKGKLAEVEEELQRTMLLCESEAYRKLNFNKAQAIELKAAICFAKRHAALARELAQKAQGKRKAELERLAEICDWVPENPARNFHEALQMMWFWRIFERWDGAYPNIPPARMDQYLYPYYRRDIAEGKLTKDEALELLECYRVKMGTAMEFLQGHLRELVSKAQYVTVTLGGQDVHGNDVTNELSYLFLEAAFKIKSPHPNLAIRVHDKTPRAFFIRALELAKLGRGYPNFYNDKSYIPWLLDFGVPLADARNWCITGCVHAGISGKSGFGGGVAWLNMGKCLEVAFNNGVDPRTGKKVGLPTGYLEEFKTFDEVVGAIKKQGKYLIDRNIHLKAPLTSHLSEIAPVLFSSTFIEDCVKRGKSSNQDGGALYTFNPVNAVGIIDIADSLAAIKKCVFEDRSITLSELKEALEANFSGKEKIRQLLLSAPKFGNDIDEVDYIARDLYQWLVEVATQREDRIYGTKYISGPYSVGAHGALGKRVGALPSGRLAGSPLADGSASPCQGMDTSGPTAVINSVGKIDWLPHYCNVHNMKFHPSAFKKKEDLEKLMYLIKTDFDYGSKHIQFNVIEKETLLDAQKHPENHRDLLIRVAGYSAFFVELEKGVQDDVIRRTEHAVI